MFGTIRAKLELIWFKVRVVPRFADIDSVASFDKPPEIPSQGACPFDIVLAMRCIMYKVAVYCKNLGGVCNVG